MADVLVVEDEMLIRLTICDYLEQAGLRFAQVADAQGAWAALDSVASGISVLVTDLNLGFGLDGFDIAAEARRRLPNLRVIYATGSPDRFSGRRLEPWEGLVVKPFDPSVLAAEVRTIVDEAHASRATAILHALDAANPLPIVAGGLEAVPA